MNRLLQISTSGNYENLFYSNITANPIAVINVDVKGVYIRNCSFTDCIGSTGNQCQQGQCIAVRNNSLSEISNCDFIRCGHPMDSKPLHSGGAVNVGGSSTSSVLKNCKFYSNTTSQGGGAIRCQNVNGEYVSSTLEINDSQFIGNASPTYGGAIDNVGFNLTLNNCLFKNNNANKLNAIGGAICNRAFKGSIVLNNCTFDGNESYDGKSGAIYNNVYAGTQLEIEINNSNFLSSSDTINNIANATIHGKCLFNGDVTNTNSLNIVDAQILGNGKLINDSGDLLLINAKVHNRIQSNSNVNMNGIVRLYNSVISNSVNINENAKVILYDGATITSNTINILTNQGTISQKTFQDISQQKESLIIYKLYNFLRRFN